MIPPTSPLYHTLPLRDWFLWVAYETEHCILCRDICRDFISDEMIKMENVTFGLFPIVRTVGTCPDLFRNTRAVLTNVGKVGKESRKPGEGWAGI